MMKRALLVLTLFSFSAPLLGDEIYLKGGGQLSGEIVEQTESTVTIDIGAGTFGVKMSTRGAHREEHLAVSGLSRARRKDLEHRRRGVARARALGDAARRSRRRRARPGCRWWRSFPTIPRPTARSGASSSTAGG